MYPVACQVTVLCGAAAVAGYQFGSCPTVLAYVLIWALFHLCEYYFTATYLPRTVTPYSFLLYGATGSAHLMAVHLASLCEHVYTRRIWSNHGHWAAGLALAVVGVIVRGAAIKTCGNSFSHYIESQGTPVLVTHGIYRICRHPSYLGFLVYVCGMQAILGNVVMLAVSLGVLGWFFVRRIRVEEWFLVHRTFPDTYPAYQQAVWALIPGVY